MKKQEQKEKKIFIVNYDWRNLFRTGKDEYFKKLQRDQLCPEINSFFFFSWTKENYEACEGKWFTVQKKTYGLEKLRPLLNLRAIFSIPYTVYKHKVRPDAWLVYDFGMVPAMWVASKLFGGTLIMMVNNNPQDCSSSRKFGKVKQIYSRFAEKIGVRFAKHFFTLNESMRAYLMGLGVPSEHIHIYTVNTIERDMEYIKGSQKGYIRKKYNLSSEKKIVLTVARLEEEKNYPQLIALFAGLPEDYVLFCLGEGSILEILQKQVKKLGIESRVYFQGNVARSEIWNYFKDTDVFVLLSKAEALGIVFWEAMYVNVPCIGSQVEGIMESLGKNGERGKIWKESDGQEEFEALVSFCVTSSNERDSMITSAKEFVEEQLNNRATINDFLDDLESR